MAYTAKHVEDTLESLSLSYNSDSGRYEFQPMTRYARGFSWDEFEELLYDRMPSVVPGLGVVTPLVVDGGGEGHGEHCELVFKLTGDDGTDQYFKKNGYYASFHGTDWDGSFYEVTPTEKTVTVYPRVDS